MKQAGSRYISFGATFVAAVLVLVLLVPLQPAALRADDASPSIDEFVVDVVELEDGSVIVGRSAPLPPPDPSLLPASPVIERSSAAGVTLSGVPAFNWCYGCSATSAAMLFGYYDLNGFPNMYAGPTNGGDCPATNASWGYGESPLSATHMGLDGLASRGHVDDYYVTVGGTSDPYVGNWTQHAYADCTADYMGTSQVANWSNADGSTSFYYLLNNGPLEDYSGSEGGTSPRRDGIHGMRLFAQSRGYTVLQNYNQYIYGFNGVSAGFTFEQYCDEIDAGRPVLIQVSGHTMLGVGYDTPATVYVHDTWDYSMHSMTWGGSYSGMTHYGVGVLRLQQNIVAPQPRTDQADGISGTGATLRGTVASDGGESCEYQFSYGTSPGSYTSSTSWTGAVRTGEPFSAAVSGLSKGQAYYFVAGLRNSEADVSGDEQEFVTLPDPPSGFSAVAGGTDSVDLSWTAGDGAGGTKVQRKTGSYPVDANDGTTVYYGAGTSCTDSGLVPDTTYYYRAWSEASAGGQWSDGSAEASATTDGVLPVVSTQAASDVTSTTAVLHGTIVDDRGDTCAYRFEYDTDTGAPYAHSTEWTGSLHTDDTFSDSVSALSPGTEYFYRGQASNAGGDSSGEQRSFSTLPAAPLALSATPAGDDTVSLSWTSGAGSSETLVVRKQGSYPANRTDGTQVYLDGGTLCADTGLTPSTTYYYRAWAYHSTSGQWSADYVEAMASTTLGGTPDIAVTPGGFEAILPPGVTREYPFTISNNGDGTLFYTVGETIPPTPPPGPGAPVSAVSTSGGDYVTLSSELSAGVTPVDEIIVKLKDDARGATARLHESIGAEFVARGSNGRFEVVRVPRGRSAADVMRDYMASGAVEYAEPNYPRGSAWTPDDPLYDRQWHLDLVDAEAAWDLRQGGSEDVVVAVLDTGVAYEDYAGYSQAPDLVGTAFVSGWDFINNDAHPNDDNGHGTHVTGTIAQATDNGIGVAGLAFGVSIMPVKVLDASGSGSVASEADGIYYAVDHGAKVINLSLSGSDTSQTEADALAYAYEHGVTVVCAAGNEYVAGNPPQYPAAYASTLAVGATRYDASRAWYSNTGSYLDIVAPGGDTSVDQNGDGYPDGVLQQTFSGAYSNFGYAYYQGTSMACPHVSATVALLLSENRSLTPDSVRAVLSSTSVDLGPSGWDEQYGCGLLDAAAALAEIVGAPWLDESPKEGSVPPSGSEDVVLTVDTTELEDGDYFATVIVSSNDPVTDTVNVPFTLHVRTVVAPVVATGAATDVEEQTATVHGTLQDYGWETCEYAFQYGTQTGGPYEQTAWSGALGSGDSFGEVLSALQEGTTYYFRAAARNSAGTGYGDELSFTTKPDAPADLMAAPDVYVPFYRINLSWIAGDGAAATLVRAKQGSYPTDPADGELVYVGDGDSCGHTGLEPSTAYYYRAWSSVEDGEGSAVWSDAAAEASTSTEAEPTTVDFSITLQPGWNMVSVPLLLPDMSTAVVFEGVEAVYVWNAETKSYFQPQEINPELGYWVAVTEVTALEYEGVPVTGWSVELSPGWHMAGSAHGGSVGFSSPDDDPDGSVEGFVYSWNPLAKSYVYSQEIEPGHGHWVASTSPCTLTVEYAP